MQKLFEKTVDDCLAKGMTDCVEIAGFINDNTRIICSAVPVAWHFGKRSGMSCRKKVTETLKLIDITNIAIQSFSDKKTIFQYSGISLVEFLTIANKFSMDEIKLAADCAAHNKWEQSKLLMSLK